MYNVILSIKYIKAMQAMMDIFKFYPLPLWKKHDVALRIQWIVYD